ncbi:MAG: hypothetical protein ABI876_11710, partial [Bacteroidota bacterium]
MNNQSLRAAALIFFFAAASTVAAFGQDGVRMNEDECQNRQEKLIKELMQATLDYWSPRFTAYQTLIDKTLSKEDLQDLNQLRGRFLLALKMGKEAQLRLDKRYSAEREADMRSMPHPADGGTMDELHFEDQERNNAEREAVMRSMRHSADGGTLDELRSEDQMDRDYAMMADSVSGVSMDIDSAAAAAYAAIDSTARAGEAAIDSTARAAEARMEASAEADGAAIPSESRVHIYMRDEEESVDPDRKAMKSASQDLETIN